MILVKTCLPTKKQAAYQIKNQPNRFITMASESLLQRSISHCKESERFVMFNQAIQGTRQRNHQHDLLRIRLRFSSTLHIQHNFSLYAAMLQPFVGFRYLIKRQDSVHHWFDLVALNQIT